MTGAEPPPRAWFSVWKQSVEEPGVWRDLVRGPDSHICYVTLVQSLHLNVLISKMRIYIFGVAEVVQSSVCQTNMRT